MSQVQYILQQVKHSKQCLKPIKRKKSLTIKDIWIQLAAPLETQASHFKSHCYESASEDSMSNSKPLGCKIINSLESSLVIQCLAQWSCFGLQQYKNTDTEGGSVNLCGSPSSQSFTMEYAC